MQKLQYRQRRWTKKSNQMYEIYFKTTLIVIISKQFIFKCFHRFRQQIWTTVPHTDAPAYNFKLNFSIECAGMCWNMMRSICTKFKLCFIHPCFYVCQFRWVFILISVLFCFVSFLLNRSEMPLSMEQWHIIRISRTARLAVVKVSILTVIVIVWFYDCFCILVNRNICKSNRTQNLSNACSTGGDSDSVTTTTSIHRFRCNSHHIICWYNCWIHTDTVW